MLHLCRRQGLSERVGDHVVGRAVHEAHRPLLDDPSNEVITHVDMLHARVVLMVAGEGDGRLIV